MQCDCFIKGKYCNFINNNNFTINKELCKSYHLIDLK